MTREASRKERLYEVQGQFMTMAEWRKSGEETLARTAHTMRTLKLDIFSLPLGPLLTGKTRDEFLRDRAAELGLDEFK